MSPLPFIGALALLAAGPCARAASPDDPLQAYRWTSRVIVALAPTKTDPNLDRQRKLYHAMLAGARERDLVLLEAVGGSSAAAALRQRFALGPGFSALLIGKDGGEKLRSDGPVGADELFPLIDSMPMRQQEMLRRP